MAEDIAKLGLKVESDQILKATKRLDKLEKQSKQNVRAAKKVGGAFKNLGAILGAAGLGFAMKAIISATIEQERVLAQLESTIKSTGGIAGKTSEELQTLARSLQEVTTFGDETIIAGEALLLTFTKIQGDVLPRTVEALLDVSTAMGQDLKTSAIQLGKALNDPILGISALTRTGITFSEEQKNLIRSLQESGEMAAAQGVILKELETQFGGSAKAARDTFGGALKGLKNAFGDLLEGGGGNLDDAKGAIEELTTLLKDPATKSAFAGLTKGVIELTGAFATGFVAVSNWSKSISGAFSQMVNGGTQLKLVTKEISETEKAIKEAKAASGEWDQLSVIEYGQEQENLQNLINKLKDLFDVQAQLLGQKDQPIIEPSAAGGITAPTGDVAAVDPVSNEEIEAIEMMRQAEEDRIESGLDLMRYRNQTEFELNEIRYLNEKDLLRMALEDEFIDKEEHNDLLIELEQDRADKMNAIAELEATTKLSLVKGALGALEALMLTGNKKQFEIAKKAAIASAIINTYQAVASGLKTEPFFPVGIAMGAIALVSGIATVKKIKSQQYGGGGSAGGSTVPAGAAGAAAGGGAAPAAQPLPGEQGGQGAGGPSRELRVVVEGDAPGSEAMRQFVENLAETIEDMGGVGSITIGV